MRKKVAITVRSFGLNPEHMSAKLFEHGFDASWNGLYETNDVDQVIEAARGFHAVIAGGELWNGQALAGVSGTVEFIARFGAGTTRWICQPRRLGLPNRTKLCWTWRWTILSNFMPAHLADTCSTPTIFAMRKGTGRSVEHDSMDEQRVHREVTVTGQTFCELPDMSSDRPGKRHCIGICAIMSSVALHFAEQFRFQGGIHMLTPAQMVHFETFGFLVLKGIYSTSEIADISAVFDHLLERDRQGRPFTGEQRQGVLGFIEKHPVLTQLAYDDRIYEAMEQLLGRRFVWIGSDGNLYVGSTQWHPDHSNYACTRIKVAFYLDPVRRDTGCLRVIPGSHHPEWHRLLHSVINGNMLEMEPYRIPFYSLDSDPGDMVIFNQKLWHASFGGKTGRRMFTLNFGGYPTSDEQIADLRRTYQSNLNFIKSNQFTQNGHIYEDSFLHHSHPRIQSMTAVLVELNLL